MIAPLTLTPYRVDAVIMQLGIAAQLAQQKNPTAVGHICTAMANIIASARWGSSEQQALMDFASKMGFEPHYYVDTIRVHWREQPAPSKRITTMRTSTQQRRES